MDSFSRVDALYLKGLIPGSLVPSSTRGSKVTKLPHCSEITIKSVTKL